MKRRKVRHKPSLMDLAKSARADGEWFPNAADLELYGEGPTELRKRIRAAMKALRLHRGHPHLASIITHCLLTEPSALEAVLKEIT